MCCSYQRCAAGMEQPSPLTRIVDAAEMPLLTAQGLPPSWGDSQPAFLGAEWPPSLPSHHAHPALRRKKPTLARVLCQRVTLGMHHPIWAGKGDFSEPVSSWNNQMRASPCTHAASPGHSHRLHKVGFKRKKIYLVSGDMFPQS